MRNADGSTEKFGVHVYILQYVKFVHVIGGDCRIERVVGDYSNA